MIVGAVGLATCGCSGRPARIPLAEIDYDEAASKAITDLDRDGDSRITRQEAAGSPAIAVAFVRVDSDTDGTLTESEIASYLRSLQDGGVAMVSWTLQVMLDGKPLKGATVTLQPAEFLQPGVLPAEGVTDARGLVTLSVDEKHRPAPHARVLHCGLYNVRVSKRSGDEELVPDRYREEPSLGVEVRPEGQADYSGSVINLSSG